MIPEMIPLSSQLGAIYYEPASDNQEQYAQRHGHLNSLLSLRDRCFLRIGTTLIVLGEKLMAVSLRHARLTEELA